MARNVHQKGTAMMSLPFFSPLLNFLNSEVPLRRGRCFLSKKEQDPCGLS